MSESARAVVNAFLEREFIRQVEFLAELVRVPSDNPPGDCAGAAERARELLESLLDLEVETDMVPEAAARASGMVSATNLIVRRRFGNGGPTIVLNAHGDVVPPGSGWSRDPYGAEIDDGDHGLVMFGRGVAVSKADLATFTWALLALMELEKHGASLHGAVELHFTYDAESGGNLGPRRLLQQRLTRPDLAICAGFSYAVTSAHNGCLHLEVIVNGKTGHAAVPSSGVDALEATTRVLQALYTHRSELAQRRSRVPGIDTPTLNVGLIQGGINTNVVPDRVTLRLDRRIVPEESTVEVEAQLRALIAAAVADQPGITLEIRTLLLAEPLQELPGAARLIIALRTHAEEEFGVAVPVQGSRLYTDARHYASAEIPTVLYGAGPRTLEEANGHAADECLRLDDLNKATAVVALTLADLLQR